MLLVNGTKVSCAVAGRRMCHGQTIGFVYTPPKFRKNGYASEITAKLSDLILSKGYQYSCLFTQLANKTTNKIYPAIGYKRVHEFMTVRF